LTAVAAVIIEASEEDPMSFYPSLPEGYTHQTVWGPERNLVIWEFHRVYDRDNRLDRARSFWILFSLDRAEFPPPRSVVRWGDVREVSFQEFGRATTKRAQVEAWIARASERRALRHQPAAGELQVA
jgi:hypothetical protein